MNARNQIEVMDIISGKSNILDNKCGSCMRSICCNSINQKIPAPRSRDDFDHLLWQVSHENINVFKDADGWFLHIQSRCVHLQDQGVCGIYARRPQVCRDYDNDFCEYDAPIARASELFFSSYQELDSYCRRRFKSWDQRYSTPLAV
jgi:uncharacterized protein